MMRIRVSPSSKMTEYLFSKTSSDNKSGEVRRWLLLTYFQHFFSIVFVAHEVNFTRWIYRQQESLF